MKYPAWFPFPVCWLRSFLILLEAQLAALVVMVAFLITSLPAALTSMAYESVFVFWMIFWGVVPPVYLFAQCDRLIWHRPQSPRSALAWLPSWKSWLEGMFAYGGLAIAALVPALIYSLSQDYRYYGYYRRPTPEDLAWMGAIAFILLAYIYHLRFLFNRQLGNEVTDLRTRWARGDARYQRRFSGGKKPRPNPPRPKAQTPKPKPKPVKPPATDLDAELEKLRRKMEGKD